MEEGAFQTAELKIVSRQLKRPEGTAQTDTKEDTNSGASGDGRLYQDNIKKKIKICNIDSSKTTERQQRQYHTQLQSSSNFAAGKVAARLQLHQLDQEKTSKGLPSWDTVKPAPKSLPRLAPGANSAEAQYNQNLRSSPVKDKITPH
ncbi:hypothetical protein U1Q18_017643 [Sarracenia purpurea var. burkii]